MAWFKSLKCYISLLAREIIWMETTDRESNFKTCEREAGNSLLAREIIWMETKGLKNMNQATQRFSLLAREIIWMETSALAWALQSSVISLLAREIIWMETSA
jgi:hypothetical protein